MHDPYAGRTLAAELFYLPASCSFLLQIWQLPPWLRTVSIGEWVNFRELRMIKKKNNPSQPTERTGLFADGGVNHPM